MGASKRKTERKERVEGKLFDLRLRIQVWRL